MKLSKTKAKHFSFSIILLIVIHVALIAAIFAGVNLANPQLLLFGFFALAVLLGIIDPYLWSSDNYGWYLLGTTSMTLILLLLLKAGA